jgi:thiamine-phosphate diphosphorylase
MMICLVSDRRRLAGDRASVDDWRRCLIAQTRYAVDAGVDLLQVRERDLEAAELARLVTGLLLVARGTTTRVIVNDRLDVALACGAGGVHLRGDSIGVAAARRMAPAGFLIGRSVHHVDELADAAGADYVIAGSVFASESKPLAAEWLGAAGLQAMVRAARMPVLAIGGITGERLDDIAAAGAAGFAAIGLFMRSEGPCGHGTAACCRATPLQGIVGQARARFDRVNTGSLT